MASLKGGDYFWNAHVLANGDKSVLLEPGPGPWVTIYINNSGAASATFAVEVSAVTTPEPGRNALDGTPDGGLIWYPYANKEATTPLSLVVASTAQIAVDLSPFGPQFIRLHCTATTGTTVTAMLSSFGPN